MTFLEAYAIHGPDTMAISEALSIPEHEADRLVSARMDRERCGPPKLQEEHAIKPKPIVRFIGYDPTEKEWVQSR